MTSNNCCICGADAGYYGNNPAPYEGDKCCDTCNWSCVIPARIGRFGEEAREDWRKEEIAKRVVQAREGLEE